MLPLRLTIALRIRGRLRGALGWPTHRFPLLADPALGLSVQPALGLKGPNQPGSGWNGVNDRPAAEYRF